MKDEEFVIKCKTEGFEEATQQVETLCDAYDGFPDADKLIEFANNTKDKTIDANDIARFPSADVRENVRGEWLPMRRFGGEKGQTPDVMCSVCFAPALWLGTLGCIRSNYCPNCGADMRGDKS